jgi:hypothetical protein
VTLRLPPVGTDGDIRLIRTSLPLVREDHQDCPRGIALRARPFLEQTPERSRRKPVEDFALAPVMRALDSVELDGTAVDVVLERLARNRAYHPGHIRWACDAVRHYLAARTEAESERRVLGRPPTVGVREEWTCVTQRKSPDARGAIRYERTAWGRRYASADGSERELWLLSVNSPRTDRPTAEIAEAASVAATGLPSRSAFRDIHRPVEGSTALPGQVRVVGVGCGDGQLVVLADWNAEEIAQRFARHAKPVLGRIVADSRLNPGSGCVRCEALAGCEQPPRTPGLLGVPAPRRPRKRRSVSATDLRMHARCPALFHLTRVLHLKSHEPESEPIRRGRAVDSWLNEQHRQGGCRDIDLPSRLPELADDEQHTALSMLGQHVRACPLDGLGPEEQVQVQKRLTAYDPVLDAVIVADPDLLYTRAGGWIWHETKTASRRPYEGRELLETHPQLALAVLLMAAGVPGGDSRRSLIELELLYENNSGREEIDPGDPDTVDMARQIIAALVGPWALDETYAPRPDRHCHGCEMLRYCTPGQERARAEESS